MKPPHPPIPPVAPLEDPRLRIGRAVAAKRSGVALRTVQRIAENANGEPEVMDQAPGIPDLVTVEAPLQVQLGGDILLTTMRTPGRDHDLALGLLYSEGLIDSAHDVSTIAPCGRPGEAGYGDSINVTPGAGHVFDAERVRAARRDSHAGCGICGREAIADVLARCRTPRVTAARASLTLAQVFAACEALRKHQQDFAATGGCHAAAAFAADGALLAHAEDVGRHNAVDKVIGQLLRQREDGPLASAKTQSPAPLLDLLAISSRAGFELVQKAILAGAQVLCSVSAPSSLAIDMADAAGLCLVGFVRAKKANIYTHGHQLVEGARR